MNSTSRAPSSTNLHLQQSLILPKCLRATPCVARGSQMPAHCSWCLQASTSAAEAELKDCQFLTKSHWEKMLWAKLQLWEGGTCTEPTFGQLRNFPLPQWKPPEMWLFGVLNVPLNGSSIAKNWNPLCIKQLGWVFLLNVLSISRRDKPQFTVLFPVL